MFPSDIVDDDDNVWGSAQQFAGSVSVGVVQGVVTGHYTGALTVVDDEPVPILSVVQSEETAVEGGFLRWELSLSTPTTGVYVYFTFVKPDGTELDTADVPKSWLNNLGIWPPSTPEPLSSLYSYFYVGFPYGVTTGTVVIPISKDGTAEGDETVMLQTFDFMPNYQPLTLVGTVPQHR